MTYAAKVANVDYARCDSLFPDNKPVKDVHYKVNLLHSEELEYRVNLSKREMIFLIVKLLLIQTHNSFKFDKKLIQKLNDYHDTPSSSSFLV